MKRPIDSDSEDDEDYVPPADDDEDRSESEDAGEDSQRLVEQEEMKEKKDLGKVWRDFQASVSETLTGSSPEVKAVKVVRKYRFAGEEHEEVVEVPENSADARKWPHYQGPVVGGLLTECHPGERLAGPNASAVTPGDKKPPPAGSTNVRPTASAPIAASSSQAMPPKRKPGPRKPKTTLAPLPNAPSKAKKITTLEKSAVDWSSHITPGDKEELEAQRRGGGGYLDKVEFMNRVDERKESLLGESGTSKRRRL